MKRLLIDAGNTQLKLRLCDGLKLAATTHALDHADRAQLQTLLQEHAGLDVYVSCVTRPAIRAQLQAALEQAQCHSSKHSHSKTQRPSHWPISPAVGLGITSSYQQPHKWGVDRWLALAAAYAEQQSACCVIDIGTATTVDICDAQGQHLGGLISPGPLALAQALVQQTALPRADEQAPQHLGLAHDTEPALQLGALHTACGLIERAYTLAKRLAACEQVILTGGGASRLAGYLDIPLQQNPDLVFQGLAMYAEQSL